MQAAMPISSVFDHPFRALVIGASGAIGQAFAAALAAEPNCVHVEQVSRRTMPGFDLLDEHSLQRCAASCLSAGPYQVVIDATGALTMGGVGPEKSLASLQRDALTQNFGINAVGPVLLLRHLAPLLDKGPVIYAKLSARVGSISDNQKGGWYGYRAAKAALNMLLHTAAIELQRKNPQLHVVALQPGTVQSALSQAFLSHVPQVLSPETSVAGMLQALKNLTPKSGAQFVDYQGQPINW